MAASLAGLYGGGFGQSQEDGSGGRSGFFARGQKNKFGAPQSTGGGQQDQNPSQLQQQQHTKQTGTAAELALLKE